MKTVVIGDIHGLGVWEFIVKEEQPDKVIFLGDYFDSYDINFNQQVNNYNKIINLKDSSDIEVILLLGNHDYHYLPSVDIEGISGYQHDYEDILKQLLSATMDRLQLCHTQGDYLFTHSGVSEVFLEKVGVKYNKHTIEDDINRLILKDPYCFDFDEDSIDASGDDPHQSCIWIRPRSLMRNSYEIKKDYIQVVGHTVQKRVDRLGKSTGGRYYFIDTLATSGEYAIIENGVMSFKSYK